MVCLERGCFLGIMWQENRRHQIHPQSHRKRGKIHEQKLPSAEQQREFSRRKINRDGYSSSSFESLAYGCAWMHCLCSLLNPCSRLTHQPTWFFRRKLRFWELAYAAQSHSVTPELKSKMLPTNFESQNSIPGTLWWKERTDSWKSSSDPHIYTHTHMRARACAHAHNIKDIDNHQWLLTYLCSQSRPAPLYQHTWTQWVWYP